VGRESDLPFRPLPAAALRGRGPLGALRGLATMFSGVGAARRMLAELRPGAILGTGGYVCVPLFLAARTLGVPTLIYLPDVVPGLAVKLLARIATLVACNVEDSAPYLGLRPDSKRLTVTGYPVRAGLFDQDKRACRQAFNLSDELPVLLAYGGSLGSRSINRAIEALLPQLLSRSQLIHICGREGDEAWLRAAAERLSPELRGRYKLFSYLESAGKDDTVTRWQGDTVSEQRIGDKDVTVSPPQRVTVSMMTAFGAADLAICRSGASTLAELPAAGLPAVLVPYPHVHQDENADYLVKRGAALKVADGAMLAVGSPTGGALFPAVIRLLDNQHERQRMAERSRSLARPAAARQLAEALRGLATRSLS
jgi:UDP-N-acetylglucosamine--N-acetylmuramyl-(pentapeptide) pyrophosphoryl-undecaprenol N-acetylglucosamine transferase